MFDKMFFKTTLLFLIIVFLTLIITVFLANPEYFYEFLPRLKITQNLLGFFVSTIEKLGYMGILILMILESTAAPVPSEAVLPFAGFLWQSGVFSFFPVFILSILGALIGSLLSYGIGFYGGGPFVRKFGKYFFLKEHHLELTEIFFEKRGQISVFLSRLIPVVRHFISIPAGTGKMNLFKFIIYTILGASLWHLVLIFSGYYLGQNWEVLQKYFHIIDLVVIIIFIFVIVYLLWRRK